MDKKWSGVSDVKRRRRGCHGPGVKADVDLLTCDHKIPQAWSIAIPLQRGEVRSCDFNRMVLEFTMLNESKMILAVGAAVMDDLEGSCNVAPDQRVDQFARLREVIEVALSVLASDELFHVDLN
jgi:hypothetical protein